MKKIVRSKKDHMITGLLGGLAEYLQVDATALRLAFLLLVIFTGIFPGVVFYILALFIVKEEDNVV